MRLKYLFDLFFSALGMLILSPLIIFCWLIASIETRSNGLFFQKRVGRYGKIFKVVKIKTMYPCLQSSNTITKAGDYRITKSGEFFRKYKLDELPQLWNVLRADMSFVGPRPDVPGYADKLPLDIRVKILSIRPGITGPASLYYKNEEAILAAQEDPKKFNDKFIYPHKVQLNLKYIDERSFLADIKYILKTLIG